MEIIENALKEQVENHYTDLLDQAQNLRELEKVLAQTVDGVNHLEDALERVREDIGRPFRGIATCTEQYARVITTCDLLRKVLRFLHHSRNMDSHLAADDIAQAAAELQEVSAVQEETDLRGIDAVDQLQANLGEKRKSIIGKATTLLEDGLNSQNQSSVSTALRAFDNLSLLVERTQAAVQVSLRRIESLIDALLDLQKPGGKAEAESFRNEVWSRHEHLVEAIYSCTLRVHTLQTVLNRTQDSKKFRSLLQKYLEDAHQSSFLLDNWAGILKILKDRLFTQLRISSPLDIVFVAEYPRLLRHFRSLFPRLAPHADPVTSGLPQLGPDAQQQLLDILFSLNKRYLIAVSLRLEEHIGAIFAPGSRAAPPPEQLTTLIKLLQREVEAASVDKDLILNVLKTLARGLKLFNVRVENMVQTTGAVVQLKEQLNAQQQLNINLYNLLIQMNTAVLNLSPGGDSEQQEVLGRLSGELLATAELALRPLFEANLSALCQILLKMHSEDWRGDNLRKQDEPQSRYMDAFQKRVLQFQSVFISRFSPSPLLQARCVQAVNQLLEYFVRSICLIRNPSPAGKLQLAADMAQGM